MEFIIGIIAILWMITVMALVAKGLSKATINITVRHENDRHEVPINDLYDKEGDVKKEHQEHEDTINFNEVFKEINEFMTGDDEVKTDG